MRPNEITLSRTKITIPGRRPEILSRARLLDKLDELLDKRLVLVTAPAGYGKTSLLVDLAKTTRMPVGWLTLDALDQEPQRFLSYFIAFISFRFPHFGSQSRAALNAIVNLEGSLENLIITIVNEIDKHIREHFILILDDYHLVDGIPEIRNFIGRFIQLVGENCHLVLASRRLPTLPDLPVLVARRQVGGFDLHELAFRPDEIRELFESSYASTLTESEVEDLAQRTEGWITGLHLIRLNARQDLPDLTRAARAVGVDLSDYFEQQVLGQQSPKIRSFLLQTSLLDEFDAALCDSVLGVGDWRAIMAAVRRSNLFALPVGSRGEWMRYHALFRDFLQACIWQESPETVQAILLRLAEVSEENGDWEKAHYALAQAGDLDTLAGLVGRAGPALIQFGRILTLSAWLDELPDPLVQQKPALLLLSGFVSLVTGKVQYGLSLFDRVVEMLGTTGDQPAMATALVRRSWAQRLLGGYLAALTDADEAIRLLAGKPGQVLAGKPLQVLVLAEAYRMKGLALFRLGRMQESDRFLKLALELFYELQRETDIPLAQMELGMARRALGDAASAQVYYEKALSTWQDQGNLPSQATLLNSLGVLYHLNGEYEKAVQTFEKGLDCARRSGYTRSQALLLASLGDLYADVEDLEAASLVYQQAGDIAIRADDQFLTRYTRISQAGIARRTQNNEQARLLLDNAGMFLQKTDSLYESGLFALELGLQSLSCAHPRQALPDLQNALENFEAGSFKTESAWAHLWLAAGLAGAGELEAAGAHIAAALIPTEGGELPAALLPVGLQANPWLAVLAGEEGLKAPVRPFLQAVDRFKNQLPALRRRLRRLTSTVPVAAPDLVIRAFGKSQVRVKGHLISREQWHSRTVKELFFLFVQTPGPLTKEQVGVMLWPESSANQLKLRFKNEVYRLRRAVGQEVILFDGSSYSFNRNLDFEYDVDSFEASLQRARSARSSVEKLRAYQEAVALVRGLYLEDYDSNWAHIDRERLRLEYLDALLTLAGLLLEWKETDQALKVCQYALAANPTNEESHRLMMCIHAARGDRMGVTRQYQACREALEGELGIAVSMETETLYHQLTA